MTSPERDRPRGRGRRGPGPADTDPTDSVPVEPDCPEPGPTAESGPTDSEPSDLGPGMSVGLGLGPGGGRYRRSVLEVAILSALVEETTHGYSLMDQIKELAGELVCIDPGSMYRLLRAMEQEGLVSSSWKTPEAGPSRRVYVITGQGLEGLARKARALSERAALMQELAEHAVQTIVKSQSTGAGAEVDGG